VIPLDDFQKFHLEDQWQISETDHLCIFGNKPHVILLKRGKLVDFEEETTKNKEVVK
jgi:hypothetical protein